MVVLLAAVGSAACGRPAAGSGPRANLICGSTGSDWYRIGSAIAERTNAALPGHPVTAMPGAGGISNPARIGLAPGDFGMSFGPLLRAAYEGRPPYRRAFRQLRHVARLLQNKLHLIVAEPFPLQSLDELRTGRLRIRIGTGPPGSAEEFLLRECLRAYGISYEDIRRWGGRVDLLGSAERAELYYDYHLDLIAFHSTAPSSVIAELMATRPGRILSLPRSVREALRAWWNVRLLTLEPGTYANQPARVETVGFDFGIFATADVDADLVYEMVKAIASSKAYLETVHPGFKAWRPADMVESGGIPIHPGAARYFREQGWIGE
jgi:TRAP transporter TAXI family solute receptor